MTFMSSVLPLAAALVLASFGPAQAFSPLAALAPAGRTMVAKSSMAKTVSWAGVAKRRQASALGPLSMAATAEAVGTDEAQEFWTRPRTTNANWGVFFDLETKGEDIWITGLRCGGHSFARVGAFTRLKLQCFTKEGSSKGAEADKSLWSGLAELKDLTLPKVQVGDSKAVYTYIPFASPVHVKANSQQSFCIHTDKKTGLVVRRKINFGGDNVDPYFAEWREGVTDEGAHFTLSAGKCPGENLFVDVSAETSMRAFVGVVDYSLKAP